MQAYEAALEALEASLRVTLTALLWALQALAYTFIGGFFAVLAFAVITALLVALSSAAAWCSKAVRLHLAHAVLTAGQLWGHCTARQLLLVCSNTTLGRKLSRVSKSMSLAWPRALAHLQHHGKSMSKVRFDNITCITCGALRCAQLPRLASKACAISSTVKLF